ncbi:MAG: LacI family DNA-binding transcriptional regulator [Hyphomicrobiales bacterium]|nr:LacI family DNA-binding transcriptional regulator [Hyphomicrobiales bacterium]
MTDIAAAAGVSPMTVSRAFRRDASVSARTREKILKIAEETGYVFDSTASNLRSQRTGFVAVTIPSLNNANFADTVRGLNDVVQEAGLQILLGYTNYDVLEEERLIQQLLQRRPEAIVVTGGHHTDRAHRLLKSAGVPVIETWDIPEKPIDFAVGFSNADAMERLVAHLHDTGAKRMVFIGGDDNGDTRGADRRRGFVKAAERLGLPYELVSLGPAPVSMREGARAMAGALDSGAAFDAAVCVSDLAAFGALTECQRRGVLVPEDLIIAGFGGFDIAEVATPSLTTVDAHSHEIGRRSGELLVSLLRGQTDGPSPQQITLIEPTLRVSDSTSR